jgi:carboxyl-terminal processing protease
MSKFFLKIISISCVIGCVFLQTTGYAITKQQVIQQFTLRGALTNHYNPIEINDAYSKDVFNLFIKRIDPNKRFLLAADITRLSVHKYMIDDEVEKGEFNFVSQTFSVYQHRINELSHYIPTLFKKPFNFTADLSIQTDPDKRKELTSKKDQKLYWKKLVTYQVLTEYVNLKQAAVSKNETISVTFNAELEKKARIKIKKELDQSFKRIKEETYEDFQNIYFDTLINVFDTHTNYYPAEKKEDFDINISGKLEGIGAVLREEDGYIKVVRIVPGSASWREGHLKAEDSILKVAQENSPDWTTIVGARVRDAVKLIRGKKGTTVRLQVKHPTGEIETINIIRDIVVIEETYAKHLIIKDKRFGHKIGYINLPKFYRDFKNSAGRNTTTDVRNAIEDLNQYSIDAMILDLRNNEGGALIDAVYTAGLFIDKGPIVQVKGNKSNKRILKDADSTINYAGPLVILINNYSASASEILAAALQDYSRAVIVGTDSFGKGTVQTFINLDKLNPAKTALFKPLGSIKLTIQKFYRINGGSTQEKGVSPDIYLPSKSTHLEVGERYLDNSLQWDTITPLTYSQWTTPINIKKLKQKSAERINASDSYSLLKDHIQFLDTKLDNTEISLNITKFVAEKETSNTESEKYTKSKNEFDDLELIVKQKNQLTEAQQASYDDFTKALKKDIDLHEVCSIINDMLDKSKKVAKLN